MDSCFALVGARQHSVAKICNTSQEPTHINCKMTCSLYQVPYPELTCAPKHALSHHVFRSARRPKCHDWCHDCAPKHAVWQRVFRNASEFRVVLSEFLIAGKRCNSTRYKQETMISSFSLGTNNRIMRA